MPLQTKLRLSPSKDEIRVLALAPLTRPAGSGAESYGSNDTEVIQCTCEVVSIKPFKADISPRSDLTRQAKYTLVQALWGHDKYVRDHQLQTFEGTSRMPLDRDLGLPFSIVARFNGTAGRC